MADSPAAPPPGAPTDPAADPATTLAALRAAIDAVDAELVALAARRTALARAAGAAKAALGRPALDPAQEGAVLDRAVARGAAAGLPADGVRTLFGALVALARQAQGAGDRPD